MSWQTPVAQVQDAGTSSLISTDVSALYEDTPWTASGEYVGQGTAPVDTGTPGLSSSLTNISSNQSWTDVLTSKEGSTNILKAATGLGGLAQMAAGSQAAASQRKIGKMNAAVLEGEAQYQLERGQQATYASRRKYQALLSSQKAAYGASGVSSSEGSPLMVLEDTYAAQEADADLIKWGAEIAATQARNKIPGVQIEAKLAANKSLSSGMESLLTAGGRYWQLNG